jgi:hypothetical protein
MVRLPRPRDHCAAGAGAVHAISFQSAPRVTLSSAATPRRTPRPPRRKLVKSPTSCGPRWGRHRRGVRDLRARGEGALHRERCQVIRHGGTSGRLGEVPIGEGGMTRWCGSTSRITVEILSPMMRSWGALAMSQRDCATGRSPYWPPKGGPRQMPTDPLPNPTDEHVSDCTILPMPATDEALQPPVW